MRFFFLYIRRTGIGFFVTTTYSETGRTLLGRELEGNQRLAENHPQSREQFTLFSVKNSDQVHWFWFGNSSTLRLENEVSVKGWAYILHPTRQPMDDQRRNKGKFICKLHLKVAKATLLTVNRISLGAEHYSFVETILGRTMSVISIRPVSANHNIF